MPESKTRENSNCAVFVVVVEIVVVLVVMFAFVIVVAQQSPGVVHSHHPLSLVLLEGPIAVGAAAPITIFVTLRHG